MKLDSQPAVGQKPDSMLLWKRALVEVQYPVARRSLLAAKRAQEQPAEEHLADW